CFATESLQMRFSGPMSQTDYFESYCAVETFLPGAINYALSAAADLLQQFIVAKVGECFCSIRFLISVRRWHGIWAGVTDPGYSVREQRKACLEQAHGAKSFRRVGKNFRTALSTNSEYAGHRDTNFTN